MSRFDTRFQTYAVPQQNREHGIEDCYLKRGSLRTGTFTVRRRFDRTYEAQGQALGISAKVERQSFYIPVSGMSIDGVDIEPQAKDQIVVNGETWQLHAPEDGTPPAELETGGYDWIVHGKLIPDG